MSVFSKRKHFKSFKFCLSLFSYLIGLILANTKPQTSASVLKVKKVDQCIPIRDTRVWQNKKKYKVISGGVKTF